MTARGVRNNNPGNIKYGAFAQSHGATGQDADGFAIFPSIDAGAGAMTSLLHAYQGQGLTTVQQMIGRWAPADDGNDVSSYAGYVARQMGVDPNAPISLDDPAVAAAMTRAMAQVENGSDVLGGSGGGGTPPAAPSGGVRQGVGPAPAQSSTPFLSARANGQHPFFQRLATYFQRRSKGEHPFWDMVREHVQERRGQRQGAGTPQGIPQGKPQAIAQHAAPPVIPTVGAGMPAAQWWDRPAGSVAAPPTLASAAAPMQAGVLPVGSAPPSVGLGIWGQQPGRPSQAPMPSMAASTPPGLAAATLGNVTSPFASIPQRQPSPPSTAAAMQAGLLGSGGGQVPLINPADPFASLPRRQSSAAPMQAGAIGALPSAPPVLSAVRDPFNGLLRAQPSQGAAPVDPVTGRPIAAPSTAAGMQAGRLPVGGTANPPLSVAELFAGVQRKPQPTDASTDDDDLQPDRRVAAAYPGGGYSMTSKNLPGMAAFQARNAPPPSLAAPYQAALIQGQPGLRSSAAAPFAPPVQQPNFTSSPPVLGPPTLPSTGGAFETNPAGVPQPDWRSLGNPQLSGPQPYFYDQKPTYVDTVPPPGQSPTAAADLIALLKRLGIAA